MGFSCFQHLLFLFLKYLFFLGLVLPPTFMIFFKNIFWLYQFRFFLLCAVHSLWLCFEYTRYQKSLGLAHSIFKILHSFKVFFLSHTNYLRFYKHYHTAIQNCNIASHIFWMFFKSQQNSWRTIVHNLKWFFF